MGLGTYLLGAVIEKAAPAIAEVAVKTTVGVTAVVAAGTTNVIGGVTEAVSEANKNRKQRDKPVKMIDSNRVTHSEYDASLICAKVAICSYIIHADSRISDEEKNYIDKIFMGIKAEYGRMCSTKLKEHMTDVPIS